MNNRNDDGGIQLLLFTTLPAVVHCES